VTGDQIDRRHHRAEVIVQQAAVLSALGAKKPTANEQLTLL